MSNRRDMRTRSAKHSEKPRGSRSAARNTKRSIGNISRNDIYRNRKHAFELLRLRRKGLSWKDSEEQAGITRRAAERLLPSAFFRDEHGRLQARSYDRYTRTLKIPTTRPGKFSRLRARGNRQASLTGIWNNAVKAAGRGDFSLIDAFPRNLYIDGVRLATSHYEVSRIAAAAAESDEPFEDIYSLVGAG